MLEAEAAAMNVSDAQPDVDGEAEIGAVAATLPEGEACAAVGYVGEVVVTVAVHVLQGEVVLGLAVADQSHIAVASADTGVLLSQSFAPDR